jgi:hypothetical protein
MPPVQVKRVKKRPKLLHQLELEDFEKARRFRGENLNRRRRRRGHLNSK